MDYIVLFWDRVDYIEEAYRQATEIFCYHPIISYNCKLLVTLLTKLLYYTTKAIPQGAHGYVYHAPI